MDTSPENGSPGEASARATVTGGTVKGDEDYLLVSLPPGFVGVLSGGSFDWLSVHPVGVARCTVRLGSASAPRHGSLGRLARSISESISAAAYPVKHLMGLGLHAGTPARSKDDTRVGNHSLSNEKTPPHLRGGAAIAGP